MESIPPTPTKLFETDVVLENPEMHLIYSEALRYNTHTKIAYFDGATTLIAELLHIRVPAVYTTHKTM